MNYILRLLDKFSSRIELHVRVIFALMFREATTRYGRDNIGLLWVIGEPLLFAGGVMIMWSFIRPPYQQGIALIPFLVTGYPPLLLMRHTIGQGVNTVSVNVNLLYHRKITVMHLFISRCLLEIIGTTLSFAVVMTSLIFLGFMDPPKSLFHVYEGWIMLSWVTFGFTVILGSIAAIYDFLEKFINLLSYMMIPVSGAFYMVAWVPYQYRHIVLSIPFVNCMEIVRRGVFGEFYPTYYSIPYTAAWGLGLTFLGFLMIGFVRNRIDIE